MMREKRDFRPVLLKVGVVSALSLIGIFFSIFKARTTKPSRPSSPEAPSSAERESSQVHQENAKGELRRDDVTFLQKTTNLGKFDLMVRSQDESSPCSEGSVDRFTYSFSPKNKSTWDKDGYLLPEFNDLVNEVDLEIECRSSAHEDVRMPIKIAGADTYSGTTDPEEEVRGLRSTINSLRERVSSLELQLMEYYGLEEQESAAMELQNRLKINNMEAKLFHLKIDALQAHKKRLEAQVADYPKVASELEDAKLKIRVLEEKLKEEAEKNKGQILALKERVVKMIDDENQALSNSVVQLGFQKMKDLEEEVEELRKSNHTLEEENSSLAQKLEYLQNFATSVLEDVEVETLKKENLHLRQENEDLTSQIDRLEAARCTDVEELVYLRWINACLRYELRNYAPAAGKTVARDLSRSLSPRSEERAKQLILEYAHKEGLDEKGISIVDFDFDQWSSCQSYLTDSSECDNSSADFSTNKTDTSSKSKIFGKLMTLLHGKETQHHRRNSSLETTPSIELKVGRSCESISGADGLNMKSRASPRGSTRLSLDLQKIPYFRGSTCTKGENQNYLGGLEKNSHDGSSCVYRVMSTLSEPNTSFPGVDQHNQGQEDVAKSELVKYAEALKGSHQDTSTRRRAASCSSFRHF